MSLATNLPIKQRFDVTCPNCDEEFSVEVLIQDLEAVSSDERGMGTEVQYEFDSEVECPDCKKSWDVQGELWEYPEGSINQVELK